MAERQLSADPGHDVPRLAERDEDQRAHGRGQDVVVDERQGRERRDDGDRDQWAHYSVRKPNMPVGR